MLMLVSIRKVHFIVTSQLVNVLISFHHAHISSHVTESDFIVLRLMHINCYKFICNIWMVMLVRHLGHRTKSGLGYSCKPLVLDITNEPHHGISNNVVGATSKVSDQPAHMRSLIRAFASRLNILLVLSY